MLPRQFFVIAMTHRPGIRKSHVSIRSSGVASLKYFEIPIARTLKRQLANMLWDARDCRSVRTSMHVPMARIVTSSPSALPSEIDSPNSMIPAPDKRRRLNVPRIALVEVSRSL